MHYSIGILINRPVDQVFNYSTDFDNMPQWVDPVWAARKISDGPIGPGTLMIESIRNGPFSGENTWETTAFVPNRLCRFEGETCFGKSVASYLFEAIGGSTQLTAEMSAEMPGLLGYVRPIAQFLHRRDREKSLETIKRILEDSGDGDDDLSA